MLKIRSWSRAIALSLLVVTASFIAGRATADQPMMQAALDSLRSAEHSLASASEDKGGHRARALELTRRAIAEVEKGIRFDRRH